MTIKDYLALEDGELLARYKQHNDANCFGVLYKRYTKMVFVLCDRYLKDSAMAKEATMHVFEIAMNAIKKYEIANFRNWLISVLRNHCYYLTHQKQKLLYFTDFFEKNSDSIMEFENIFTLTDKQGSDDEFDVLYKAIEMLPKDQKACVNLFYLEGLSYQAIEETTGYNYNSIKSHLQNGRRNLKNYILKLTAADMLLILAMFNFSIF